MSPSPSPCTVTSREGLEVTARDGHELGHGREVPVGRGEVGVPEVNSEREDLLVDVLARVALTHESPHREGVSHVVDSR